MMRRPVWQFGLIVGLGGIGCALLGCAIAGWTMHRPFDVGLAVVLAAVVTFVGLPGPIWLHWRRLHGYENDESELW